MSPRGAVAQGSNSCFGILGADDLLISWAAGLVYCLIVTKWDCIVCSCSTLKTNTFWHRELFVGAIVPDSFSTTSFPGTVRVMVIFQFIPACILIPPSGVDYVTRLLCAYNTDDRMKRRNSRMTLRSYNVCERQLHSWSDLPTMLESRCFGTPRSWRRWRQFFLCRRPRCVCVHQGRRKACGWYAAQPVVIGAEPPVGFAGGLPLCDNIFGGVKRQ